METTADRRIERFEADLAEMRLTTGRPRVEHRVQLVAVVVAVLGLVLAAAGYVASLNVEVTPGSNIDVLDSNSHQILALIGLALAVCGTLVYVRYALARFLRVWLLRQIHEQRAALEDARGQGTATE